LHWVERRFPNEHAGPGPGSGRAQLLSRPASGLSFLLISSARPEIVSMSTPHFPIYMDYSATNPCDPRVVDAMIPWLREHFGNPASRSHAWGWEAEKAVETAREQLSGPVALPSPTTSPSKARRISTRPKANT
jgi:Aminotransferase class-V